MATTPSPTPQHILIIPFPAHGHQTALLDLAHGLSLRHGFALTVLVTPQNLPSIQPFLSATPAAAPLLLPLPSSSPTSLHGATLPSGLEHATRVPPHIHFVLLSRVLSLLRPQILSWAKSVPNPISLIISDFFLGWTETLARDIGVPRVNFVGVSAATIATIDYLYLHVPKRSTGTNDEPIVQLSSLPSSPSFPFPELPRVFRCYQPGNPDWEFIRESFLANCTSWGVLVNTYNALESEYISYLKRFYGHDRVWAVGPIQPTGPTASHGGDSSVSSEELATWLAACPPKSVVYVCFGSQHGPSEPQTGALASALELSGTRFIWALGGSPAAIPEGFEERTRGKGLVIRGWAPQVEILGHPAVGSMLTHCGWNSVLEGLMAGVPLLTWPMGADHFINARLLAGITLRKAAGGPDAVLEAAELAKAFAESIEMRERSTEVRKRTIEMRREAEVAVEEGGSSYKDVLDFANTVSSLGVKE